MSTNITLFGATWCAYCVQLRKRLDDAGISYTHKNVDKQENEQAMLEASGGRYLIPTVVVGEQVMQNPTLEMVKDAMKA